MTAYYNEIDPAAAAWLRELIKHNLIAPGDVDERSIEDVTAADLMGYDQCHFFAGVGIWSHALRLSGIPDDFKVWTGSCPCQPFSAAGKGEGFADERHLWPAFGWLIQQCRPERVFGEQVAGKDGLAWLDLVSADMEALGYSVGAVPFAAAGIGAPHIRERLYWVADAEGSGWRKERQDDRRRVARDRTEGFSAGLSYGGRDVWMGHAKSHGHQWAGQLDQPAGRNGSAHDGSTSRMADDQLQQRPISSGMGDEARGWQQEPAAASGLRSNSWPGATDTLWSDADWLGCRDGKWRPVEPGTQPLAHGAAARVGRLRGYGNGLVAQQAQAFIESYTEVRAAQ